MKIEWLFLVLSKEKENKILLYPHLLVHPHTDFIYVDAQIPKYTYAHTLVT